MEGHEALVYKYLQGKFGQIDVSVFDEVLASDYKEHQPSITRSSNGAKDFATKLLVAFPKQLFDIEDEIAKDDKVVFRYNWHAAQTGQFMDWPATNKNISTQGIIIARITNNKIAEIWEEWDFAGFLRQINK